MSTVFISYAHEDKDLAIWLTDCLRAAGEDPWRDEERFTRGEVLDTIARVIDQMDCGVFLVSEHWLTSDWGRKEAQLFDDRDDARRTITRVPVYLEPYSTLKKRMPPELSHIFGVDCSASVDREAALWNIYCKIKDRPPGPASRWKAEGARLAGGTVPVPLTEMVMDVRALEAEVLECDRDVEFKLLQKRYGEKEHHLFLIAGARCEAHDYFLSRIIRKLTGYTRVRPEWRGGRHPASEGVYRECLAAELDCGVAEVPRRLRSLLERQTVLLVHPPIDRDYDDESIVAGYTKWLPALIDEVKPAHRLKCVQPIAWDLPKGLAQAARRWFGGGQKPPKEAEELMQQLEQIPALRTARVTLKPITETDVQDFCELFQICGGERELLLRRLQERKAETSEEILRTIDTFMEERRARAAG